MKPKLKYPGKGITVSFIRKTMMDGKWFVAADIENRAKQFGLVVPRVAIGQYMGQLEADGFLRSEEYAGQKMWKVRKCVLEAVK